MGLICIYKGYIWHYMLGLMLYMIAVGTLLFSPIPVHIFSVFQVFAVISCNVANIPQILLAWKNKSTSWSWISAFMGTTGNVIKMGNFTYEYLMLASLHDM